MLKIGPSKLDLDMETDLSHNLSTSRKLFSEKQGFFSSALSSARGEIKILEFIYQGTSHLLVNVNNETHAMAKVLRHINFNTLSCTFSELSGNSIQVKRHFIWHGLKFSVLVPSTKGGESPYTCGKRMVGRYVTLRELSNAVYPPKLDILFYRF